MPPLGHHLLLDAWGLPSALLDDPVALQALCEAAAREGGAGVVESRFHQFVPQGVSGVVVLSESHLALHTWPERGFAALDVFTCGDPAVGSAVVAGLLARLSPSRHTLRRQSRGEP